MSPSFPTLIVPAAALLLCVAGCSSDPSPSAADPAPTTAVATSAAPTTGPGDTPSTSTLSPPADDPDPQLTGKRITLTGKVSAGVESGCRILTTTAGTYLLTSPAGAAAKLGETVTVEGQLLERSASYCQQGTLLSVTRVVR